MPIATSSRPWSVPAMSTSSSSGLTDSPPSGLNRVGPTACVCREGSDAPAAPRARPPATRRAEPLLADVLRLQEGLERRGGVEPAEDVLLLLPVGLLVPDLAGGLGAAPRR